MARTGANREDPSASLKRAIALLNGGNEARVASLVDNALAGALLATSLSGHPYAMSLIGAKNELVKLIDAAIKQGAKRLRSQSATDRIATINAAHGLIIVGSYIEAITEIYENQTGVRDSIALFGSDAAALLPSAERSEAVTPAGLVLNLDDTPRMGGSAISLAELRPLVWGYFNSAVPDTVRFVRGLRGHDQLDETVRNRIEGALISTLADQALQHYGANFRRLAAQVPEFWVFTQIDQTEALQTLVMQGVEQTDSALQDLAYNTRNLTSAMHELNTFLREINGGSRRSTDTPATQLTNAYRALLDRTRLDNEGLAEGTGVQIPTPAEAYIEPAYRIASSSANDDISSDRWWETETTERSDLRLFITAWLLAPEAATTPLLVLGNPGSGKSLLTSVLAGQLPPSAYMPLRLELRQAPTDASLLAQLDAAVYEETQGAVRGWQDALHSLDGQIPVVFLDGLDELLQSSATSRADYLEQVQEFQARQIASGVPAIFIVTSRTIVSDRVRLPRGSRVIRLSEFDQPRVSAWINVWNAKNRQYFESASVEPLAALHPGTDLFELAKQPLLLLMIAIFDADGNSLKDSGIFWAEVSLYENLLRSFTRREVFKSHPEVAPEEAEALIESELRRLSFIALSMFNRGAQFVRESELTEDINTLSALNLLPLSQSAEIDAAKSLGRFFFVYEAKSTPSKSPERRTYEFLHATFAEYLLARLFTSSFGDIDEIQRVKRVSTFSDSLVDDRIMRVLFSAAPLCRSFQVLRFIETLFHLRATDAIPTLQRLLSQVTDHAMGESASERFVLTGVAGQSPVARHAVYTCNLLLTAAVAVVRGTPDFVVERAWWRRNVLLWRSQLDVASWNLLVGVLAVTGTVDDDKLAVRIVGIHTRDDDAPVTSVRPPNFRDFSEQRVFRERLRRHGSKLMREVRVVSVRTLHSDAQEVALLMADGDAANALMLERFEAGPRYEVFIAGHGLWTISLLEIERTLTSPDGTIRPFDSSLEGACLTIFQNVINGFFRQSSTSKDFSLPAEVRSLERMLRQAHSVKPAILSQLVEFALLLDLSSLPEILIQLVRLTELRDAAFVSQLPSLSIILDKLDLPLILERHPSVVLEICLAVVQGGESVEDVVGEFDSGQAVLRRYPLSLLASDNVRLKAFLLAVLLSDYDWLANTGRRHFEENASFRPLLQPAIIGAMLVAMRQTRRASFGETREALQQWISSIGSLGNSAGLIIERVLVQGIGQPSTRLILGLRSE